MAEYIEREKAIRETINAIVEILDIHNSVSLTKIACKMRKIPTADVVEVVRCCKCKYWEFTSSDVLLGIDYGKCTNCDSPCHSEEETTGGNYCSYGERRCE